MSLVNIISIVFNALVGAGLGSLIVLMLKKITHIGNFLYSNKMMLVFLIVCSFLGAYFNITQLTDVLLNLALKDRNPVAIAGVGVLLLFFSISLFILLKGQSKVSLK